ncbi:acyl carrier protein [Aquirufa sp. ROCK-SH2]
MERNQILLQIQEIFREVLDNDDIILSEEIASNDIEDWDSLTHIMLIVDLEKKFKIKFSSNEILNWKNIGEMIDSIISKL